MEMMFAMLAGSAFTFAAIYDANDGGFNFLCAVVGVASAVAGAMIHMLPNL